MGTNFLSSINDFIDFSNNYLAGGVITVCLLCFIMLVANVLRRKIRLLRRSFMPTCVIAGFLGLILKETVFAITKAVNGEGYNIFHMLTLQGIVFHFLSIGFIALCLREKDDYKKEFDKPAVKKERVSAFKSGSVIVSSYLMQGIVGIIVVALLAVTFMPQLNEGIGLMLPLSFGQGPGQATSIGSSWDKMYDGLGVFAAYGPPGLGLNFGVTMAAMGFVWASIPGIILVNRIAKKKGILLSKNEYEKSGETLNQMIEEPDEIPLSESIDKFSLQVCMVGAVYLVTLGLIVGIEALFRLSGVQFLIDQIPTIWGFAFMISVLVALLVKMIMRRLFRAGVMHRKYPNSYMMNRISGAAFDISTTAALFLISVIALGELWIPVIAVSIVGGIVTIFFVRFMCERVYPKYKDEAFLAMYGMMTGTISNGMILLREIDKGFDSPAADDLVVGSSTAIVLGFPLFVLIPLGVANNGNNFWWVAIILAFYLAGLLMYMLGIYKRIFNRIFKRAPIADGDAQSLPQEKAEVKGEAVSESEQTETSQGSEQ